MKADLQQCWELISSGRMDGYFTSSHLELFSPRGYFPDTGPQRLQVAFINSDNKTYQVRQKEYALMNIEIMKNTLYRVFFSSLFTPPLPPLSFKTGKSQH